MTQKVMYPGLVNSPETTLTNGISETDTLIYVLDPARVPEPPNLMTLGTGTNAETVLVTAINDNALTVQRGFQGIAKAWPAGTVIARNFTEYDYDALKSNVEDLDAGLTGLAGEGRTTETVKGNADTLATHLAETAPHAELANRTITVGVGKDFTTIQGAIDSLKKRIDAIITINVDAGTYAENIEISGFYGRGALVINGGSDLESAANYVVNGFYVIRCNGISVNITGFEGIDNTSVFRGRGSTYVNFRYCRTENSGQIGFWFDQSCNASVGNCLVSNKSTAALNVEYNSTVFSASWTAGSGNTRGIYCRSASTVGKYGTQPQGATAEVADQGGAIR